MKMRNVIAASIAPRWSARNKEIRFAWHDSSEGHARICDEEFKMVGKTLEI
jgi:hypothetical protein